MSNPSLEPQAPKEENGEKSFPGRKIASPAFWLTFLIMEAAWLVLSGRFDYFHLGLGIISCLLVAYFSSDLLFDRPPAKSGASIVFSYLAYLPWILGQVCLANWHVLKICLSPRIIERIDPHLITFRSSLKSELSLVTLANSITLTPGTITVRVTVDGLFMVHAIDAKSGDLEGLKEMERKVARAFREET